MCAIILLYFQKSLFFILILITKLGKLKIKRMADLLFGQNA